MSPLALSLTLLQAQPDSRLVALAREGHERAFEALVCRYRKELVSYCRRLQLANAEDAVQQTLLQAWRALKAGADVRDVRPWLYRIAHNVTVSNLRAPLVVPHEMHETASGAELEQLVEQRLEARAALAGIASLPARQRQVMVSAVLDGASHEEIATALALSSGSVRGLIYRARAALRAAAAAVIPSPALGWALRRAETRGAGTTPMVEALAGGGGAGVAGLVAKGGAVVSLAGALAGASGVILPHAPGQDNVGTHLVNVFRAAHLSPAADLPTDGLQSTGAAPAHTSAPTRGATGSAAAHKRSASKRPQARYDGSGAHNGTGSSGGPDGGVLAGSSGGSGGGSTAGSPGGSAGGSEGGSTSAAAVASLSSGSGSGGSDGGTSRGSEMSPPGAASDASSASDGSSVPDGSSSPAGSSSSGSGSSGSGDTSTAPATSGPN